MIAYEVVFTVPEGERHTLAQFEALTGYMPSEFSRFWKFDRASHQLQPLDDGPGEQPCPVVLATPSGSHAMGIYSPDHPDGYGRFRFKDEKVNKWNCVFRVRDFQRINPGKYAYRMFVAVGSLEDARVRSNGWRVTDGGPPFECQCRLSLRLCGRQGLWIVDDQVMAVVGRHDQHRLVPVAVRLDPVDDHPHRLFAAVDRADGVIEVVVVQGEIHVAGLDEECEGLALPGGEHRQGGARHVGQRWVFVAVGRRVRFGCPADAGGRVVVAVGGSIREVVNARAKEPEQTVPPRAARSAAAASDREPLTFGAVSTTTYLPPLATSIAALSLSAM